MLKDILNHQALTSVEPDSTVFEAAKLMEARGVGCVMVLSNDKPRGILTDRDIVVRCLAKNVDSNDCTVENVMTEAIEVCHDTDGIYECIQKMKKAKIRRIPVVDDDGKAVGIISFGDLLGVLSKEFDTLVTGLTGVREFPEDKLEDKEDELEPDVHEHEAA